MKTKYRNKLNAEADMRIQLSPIPLKHGGIYFIPLLEKIILLLHGGINLLPLYTLFQMRPGYGGDQISSGGGQAPPILLPTTSTTCSAVALPTVCVYRAAT
jgi:hypothetical protein